MYVYICVCVYVLHNKLLVPVIQTKVHIPVHATCLYTLHTYLQRGGVRKLIKDLPLSLDTGESSERHATYSHTHTHAHTYTHATYLHHLHYTGMQIKLVHTYPHTHTQDTHTNTSTHTCKTRTLTQAQTHTYQQRHR